MVIHVSVAAVMPETDHLLYVSVRFSVKETCLRQRIFVIPSTILDKIPWDSNAKLVIIEDLNTSSKRIAIF